MVYRPEDHSLDGISILLVEDELDTATLFTFVLESFGAEVVVAGTVAEGFRKAEEIQPDIVISNVYLPDGSGLDLLERLRNSSLERIRNLPVVAVTGATPIRAQTIKEEMRSAGFQAFLGKPVDPAELVALLLRVIEGQSQG